MHARSGSSRARWRTDGWDGLAVGEAHGLLPDPYVALALAASATSTLKVGTAVAVPLRHPLLAAGAMATLQGVADGRASFSIGRGDGAMKVLQRDAMPVKEFESYLSHLQGFLRGEDVEMGGAVASMARLGTIDPSLDVAEAAGQRRRHRPAHDQAGRPPGRRRELRARR